MRELREVEAGLEVGGHEARVELRRGLRGGPEHGLPGVVDEDVQPAAQLLPRRGNELLPVGARRDVAGCPRDAREATVSAPLVQALLQVGVAAGAGVHAHPEPRELVHDGAPAG